MLDFLNESLIGHANDAGVTMIWSLPKSLERLYYAGNMRFILLLYLWNIRLYLIEKTWSNDCE